MYVTTMVADRIHNIVATSIQPDAKLYEPEGGSPRSARAPWRRRRRRRGAVSKFAPEHRLAVARVAERKSANATRRTGSVRTKRARSAMEEANKARLAAAAANASVAAIESRWDEFAPPRSRTTPRRRRGGEARVQSARRRGETAREALEEHKENVSRARKARDTIAVAPTSACGGHDAGGDETRGRGGGE